MIGEGTHLVEITDYKEWYSLELGQYTTVDLTILNGKYKGETVVDKFRFGECSTFDDDSDERIVNFMNAVGLPEGYEGDMSQCVGRQCLLRVTEETEDVISVRYDILPLINVDVAAMPGRYHSKRLNRA